MKLPLRAPTIVLYDWLERNGHGWALRPRWSRAFYNWHWTAMVALVGAMVAARLILWFAC